MHDHDITEVIPTEYTQAGRSYRLAVYGQFSERQAPALIKDYNNIEITSYFESDIYDNALIINCQVKRDAVSGAAISLNIWHDSDYKLFTNILNLSVQ